MAELSIFVETDRDPGFFGDEQLDGLAGWRAIRQQHIEANGAVVDIRFELVGDAGVAWAVHVGSAIHLLPSDADSDGIVRETILQGDVQSGHASKMLRACIEMQAGERRRERDSAHECHETEMVRG